MSPKTRTDNAADHAGVSKCPSCGGPATVETKATEFMYGRGNAAVMLRTEPVPIGTCAPCGLSFADSRIEDAQDEAVVAYRMKCRR